MNENRRKLWIAMSELWLDTPVTDGMITGIAEAVRQSGLSKNELEDVFRFELAPFLGRNQTSVAGVWDGFDPDWVCSNAQERVGQRRLIDRVRSSLGWTTSAARPAWERVLGLAFGDSDI